MKIIKSGNPWWVGKHVTCGACGAELELELKDRPTLGQGLEQMGDIVPCPECRDVIAVAGNPAIEKAFRENLAFDSAIVEQNWK